MITKVEGSEELLLSSISYLYASEEPNFLQKHHVIFPMPTSTDHSFRSRLFSREREMARPKRARDDFFFSNFTINSTV